MPASVKSTANPASVDLLSSRWSFIHSSIHPSINSFIHLFIHPYFHSPILSFIFQLFSSSIHSPTHLCIYFSIYPLPNFFLYSSNYTFIFIHLLLYLPSIHPPIHPFIFHPSIYPLIFHQFFSSPIHLPTLPIMNSCIHFLFTHPRIYAFIHPFIHACIHPGGG